jgi:hypothetical protein
VTEAPLLGISWISVDPTHPQTQPPLQGLADIQLAYLMAGATLGAIPMHPGPPWHQFIPDGSCRPAGPIFQPKLVRIAHGSGMT